MAFLYLLAGSFLLAGFLIRLIARRFRPTSISHLSGPAPGSWLVGNYADVQRPENVGDAEFAWMKLFGTSLRIKGLFGSDMLLTADPKALQWILNARASDYPRPLYVKVTTEFVLGKSVLTSDGVQHARQRKVMDPAFSHSSIRAFVPLFQNSAQKTVAKWKDLIAHSDAHDLSVINISAWLGRTTLDAIGIAAFDYDFRALEEVMNNKLTREYQNLTADLFLDRSDWKMAFEELCGYIPRSMLSALRLIPSEENKRLENFSREALRVAKSLVAQQLELHAVGKEGGKDIMSLLVKANLSENTRGRLEDDEILGQLTTLMFAGHETTASALTWALYELSKNPEVQHNLREEIKGKRAEVAQRGQNGLSSTDLESMKYLGAVIKETLRYHPIGFYMPRVAARDDVIPLSTPHRTQTGEMITSIPVSKGQRIVLSVAAYNRLPSLWGEDADVWNPLRFLEGVNQKSETGFGFLGNLASFGSGMRNCIGWRFAVLEMQAILVELVDSFVFSPPPGSVEIRRAAAHLMQPVVKGSGTGRAEMPLTVSPVM